MEKLVRRIVLECPSCGHKIAKLMRSDFGQYRVCDKCGVDISPTKKERDKNKRKKTVFAKWK